MYTDNWTIYIVRYGVFDLQPDTTLWLCKLRRTRRSANAYLASLTILGLIECI